MTVFFQENPDQSFQTDNRESLINSNVKIEDQEPESSFFEDWTGREKIDDERLGRIISPTSTDSKSCKPTDLGLVIPNFAEGLFNSFKCIDDGLQVDLLDTFIDNENPKDIHVKYKISSSNQLEGYARRKNLIYRRYSEFQQLKNLLETRYPICVFPPFPSKRIMSYNDRLQSDFTENRRICLQRYMNRLSAHPIFQSSPEIREFLENSVYAPGNSSLSDSPSDGPFSPDHFQKNRSDSQKPCASKFTIASSTPTILDRWTEKILGVFTSPSCPDIRYDGHRKKLSELEKTLISIYELFQKQGTIQADIWVLLEELSGGYEKIAMTGEGELRYAFRGISDIFHQESELSRDASSQQYQSIRRMVKDHIAYIRQGKALLDRRDSCQVNVEELTSHVTSLTRLRDSLRSKCSSLDSSTRTTTASTFFEAFSNFRSNRISSSDKLAEVEIYLHDSVLALSNCNKELDLFNGHVEKELDLIDSFRQSDLCASFSNYISSYIAFHRKSAESWKRIIKDLATSSTTSFL